MWGIKNSAGRPALFFLVSALRDRAHGAGASAGAAIDAGAGVDDVLGIALGDRAHGTAVRAGTAADASVTDNIGHDMYTSIKMVLPILAHFLKKAMFIFGDFKTARSILRAARTNPRIRRSRSDWLNPGKLGHDGKKTLMLR